MSALNKDLWNLDSPTGFPVCRICGAVVAPATQENTDRHEARHQEVTS